MELKAQEIFAVGKWNGMEFDRADLEAMVDTFDRLREVHKVPLKFGHNEDQPLTDGKPALGWVDAIYISDDGRKLLADFSDVPDVVVKAISKRLYRKVSVEIDFAVRHQGKYYPMVLSGVALLGADLPAVNTLADLEAFMGSAGHLTGMSQARFTAVEGELEEHTPAHGDPEMDEKEIRNLVDEKVSEATKPLKDSLEAIRKERDDLKAENEKLAAKAKKADELEAEAAKEKVELARKAVNDRLDKAVEAKQITPAQREAFAKTLKVEDDERVQEITTDDLDAVLGTAEDKSGGRQGFRATREGDEGASGDEAPDEALDRLTHKYMAENGEKDYAGALRMVMRANPELAKAHVRSNLEVAR